MFNYYAAPCHSDKKDRYHKIADATLKPAVLAFGKKISLQSPASKTNQVANKILKIALFILFVPITLPMTIIGAFTLIQSKSYKQLKADLKLEKNADVEIKRFGTLKNKDFGKNSSKVEIQRSLQNILSEKKTGKQPPNESEKDELTSKILSFVEKRQPPKSSDFSTQIESEICLDVLKRVLLNPKFVYTDTQGKKWCGGHIRALSGGSGGVYALGLNLEKQKVFKPLLVAKVMDEEPGRALGEVFSPLLVSEIDAASQNPDLVPEYDPLRVGIAPGKGVLNEYLASQTPFSSYPATLSKISHKNLKDPVSSQLACLVPFIESEGSFDALSKAAGYIEQAKFALRSAPQEQKALLEKRANAFKQYFKKADLLRIEQNSSLATLEDKIDFEGFENVMAQDLLTRNQDAQVQNLLLVKKENDRFELKAIDYGAIYSSLYMTKDRAFDLPIWTTLKVSKQPIGKSLEMKEKIAQLSSKKMITLAKHVYGQHDLRLDEGAENGIRASVALLKSALQNDFITFEIAARITFLPASNGYANELTKAIKISEKKIAQELLEGAVIEDREELLERYLLEYFASKTY